MLRKGDILGRFSSSIFRSGPGWINSTESLRDPWSECHWVRLIRNARRDARKKGRSKEERKTSRMRPSVASGSGTSTGHCPTAINNTLAQVPPGIAMCLGRQFSWGDPWRYGKVPAISVPSSNGVYCRQPSSDCLQFHMVCRPHSRVPIMKDLRW